MSNETHNEQFKVLDIKVENVRVEVYLLNPGKWFEGFGGSRSGLTVGQTASLIVRRRGPFGIADTEYDIMDKIAWEAIEEAIKAGYTPHDTVVS